MRPLDRPPRRVAWAMLHAYPRFECLGRCTRRLCDLLGLCDLCGRFVCRRGQCQSPRAGMASQRRRRAKHQVQPSAATAQGPGAGTAPRTVMSALREYAGT